ncbi:hypothetical protein GCM10007315_02330 [Gemmobacter tilapiae]|uniref:Uncharacterized protein n=1 Tax=Neogemmobacter tilapiae TaxID=875041 RepID=A0A918TE30_9RHOB|nr:hypothetical protein GCM10007315_02330 [Gemmobacter tilapiae]
MDDPVTIALKRAAKGGHGFRMPPPARGFGLAGKRFKRHLQCLVTGALQAYVVHVAYLLMESNP